MNTNLQLLCRRLLIFVMPVWLLAGPSVAQSNLGPARSAPEIVLQDGVKRWVSDQQKVSPEAVDLLPFDPRLRIQACDVALQFDQPFSSPETVRARCPQPVWQLFARVQLRQGRMNTLASQAEASQVPPPARVPVVVASTMVPRGTVLTEAHVRLAEVDTPGVGSPAFEKVADVMHAEVLRDLRPGVPIRSQDVRPALLVRRGQMVLLTVGQGGFMISARLEAMQDGRMGEQIQLRNRESGRIMTGVVKGPNQALGV